MKYVGLGTSGLKVSPICLGAMTFGKQTSAAVAAKMVHVARDAGINFIDTAESYVMGESEKIVRTGCLRPSWDRRRSATGRTRRGSVAPG